MHTPILRDYFLSDKHICILDQGTMKCLCCEFVNIYREVIACFIINVFNSIVIEILKLEKIIIIHL